MSTITNAPALLDGRSLLDPALFARLERRIRTEHPELAPNMPGRIMDQALAFLGAAAVTTRPIGPSELVDIGWHTFILYTVDYAAFCERVAGRFIHHVPNEDEDAVERGADGTLDIADCETGNCQCTKPPVMESGIVQEGTAVESLERGGLKATVRAIRDAGYRVDPALWSMTSAADCTQCYNGCSDTPNG